MRNGKRMVLGLVAMAGLAACGRQPEPETAVRAVLAAAENAVEARDVGALMDLVAEDYRDADGRDARELARYVRGYFVVNQSIHLLTRIERLEFPANDVAEVELVAGMVGREAESASAWDLAAEVRSIRLTLMRQGSDWKVTHVDAGGRFR